MYAIFLLVGRLLAKNKNEDKSTCISTFFCLKFKLQASGNLNIGKVTSCKELKFLFDENCSLPEISLNSFRR